MTPIEKAAQEAAENLFDFPKSQAEGAEIILRHLAPVQAELDEKDRLLNEAKRLVELSETTYCGTGDFHRECQRWLEKVNPGDRKS